MPLYGFSCPQCNKYYEELGPYQEPHNVRCQCGTKMVRIPGAPVFKVKGYNATNGYAIQKHDKKVG